MLNALRDLANTMKNTEVVHNWLEAATLLRARVDYPVAFEVLANMLAAEPHADCAAVLSRNRNTGELIFYMGSQTKQYEGWFRVEPEGLRCIFRLPWLPCN